MDDGELGWDGEVKEVVGGDKVYRERYMENGGYKERI